MQEAERKIPMSYASRYRAGGMNKQAYLPFKVRRLCAAGFRMLRTSFYSKLRGWRAGNLPEHVRPGEHSGINQGAGTAGWRAGKFREPVWPREHSGITQSAGTLIGCSGADGSIGAKALDSGRLALFSSQLIQGDATYAPKP